MTGLDLPDQVWSRSCVSASLLKVSSADATHVLGSHQAWTPESWSAQAVSRAFGLGHALACSGSSSKIASLSVECAAQMEAALHLLGGEDHMETSPFTSAGLQQSLKPGAAIRMEEQLLSAAVPSRRHQRRRQLFQQVWVACEHILFRLLCLKLCGQALALLMHTRQVHLSASTTSHMS